MSESSREPVMNQAIEFHDSTVSDIRVESGGLTIRLSPAIVHRSTGTPGEAPGTCWAQDAELYLPGATVQGSTPQLPCTLSDDSLALGGAPFYGLLPVPWKTSGSTLLELVFVDGETIRIEAIGLRISLTGVAKYLDDGPIPIIPG
jgi:hypothetical protein